MNNSTENFTTSEASANPIGTLNTQQICVFSINFMLGVPTHLYVLWLIITGRGNGVASEFFNLNLSVCEIGNYLNCLFFIWFSQLTLLAEFLLGIGITGRPLFQSLICIERYLAVVHPVTFLKSKPLRYRLICCSVVWIITLGSCFSCILDLFGVYIWFVSLQFLFFLFIELFCCLAVLRALKQSGPGERRRERNTENHVKRRAFYLILITTANTIIFYVPFLVSVLLLILTQQFFMDCFYLSFIFGVFASFVQPALYLYRVGKLSCLFSLLKSA